MTIVHENMEPVLIPDDHSEFLEVDIAGILLWSTGKYQLGTRTEFFIELESRIVNAKESQTLICIKFDTNSKFGKYIISGDLHEISSNGKILLPILRPGKSLSQSLAVWYYNHSK
jgi:hypothetical protein